MSVEAAGVGGKPGRGIVIEAREEKVVFSREGRRPSTASMTVEQIQGKSDEESG